MCVEMCFLVVFMCERVEMGGRGRGRRMVGYGGRNVICECVWLMAVSLVLLLMFCCAWKKGGGMGDTVVGSFASHR
jgi:hypothetical protein